MQMKTWWLTFGLVLSTLSITYAGDVQSGGSQVSTSVSEQGHRNVIGTVSQVTDNMLSVKTEEGTTRNFTVKSAAIDGVTKLQRGDRVVLELNEGNQIIGITDIGEKHQLVRGKVAAFDQNKEVITLTLKNGTSQSYGMKEAMAGKMNNIEKGTLVTLMVDQRNNLAIDVHLD